MRIVVTPGGTVEGEARVPGDKSIAHRWLILAATAEGRSEIHGLPVSLDVRSTARSLAAIAPPGAAAELEAWASHPVPTPDGDGSTSNKAEPRPASIVLEAEGRVALRHPDGPVECGNSGTTMRLLAGVLAPCAFEATLTGDESLSTRPMERVAEPLRAMGAEIRTTGGRAPVTVVGGPLHGIEHAGPVPSAQVKGAVLLAGLEADGETTVREPAATRDHTERVLAHLGAPVDARPGLARLRAFRHRGFRGTVPGDVSSAAFLLAAAALTGGGLTVREVGLNPSRTHVLEVLRRMGVRTVAEVTGHELGEPLGDLSVEPSAGLAGTSITEDELPLLIDEVPVLALLAAHARGETWFLGAGELRHKESDRLTGLVDSIRALGGGAGVEDEDLVVAGGGLAGGTVGSGGDHRMAMALAVGALAAHGPVTVDGIEDAEVSFPGFVGALDSLGARVDR